MASLILLIVCLMIKSPYTTNGFTLSRRKSVSIPSPLSFPIKQKQEPYVSLYSKHEPKYSDESKHEFGMFGKVRLPSHFIKSLHTRGIFTPTTIQANCFPPIIKGDSVVIQGQTGGGKTFAFLLPVLKKAMESKELQTRASLVIAVPTRELAIQIFRDIKLLIPDSSMAQCISSDTSNDKEDVVAVTAPIIIGSVKRLAEVLLDTAYSSPVTSRRGYATAHKRSITPFEVKYFIMDEVDRLVSLVRKHAPAREKMGRKRHPRPVDSLLTAITEKNPKVQVVACSATVGRSLRRWLAASMRRQTPLQLITDHNHTQQNTSQTGAMKEGMDWDSYLDMAQRNSQSQALLHEPEPSQRVVPPSTICHTYLPCVNGILKTKLEALLDSIDLYKPSRVIVFLPPSLSLDTVKRYITKAGYNNAMLLHHVIEQPELLVDAAISTGDPAASVPILIGSESSTRGLHIDGVDMVYIVSKPQNTGEYLHMAGRTGRCGLGGTVVSLATKKEIDSLKIWSKFLRFNISELVLG